MIHALALTAAIALTALHSSDPTRTATPQSALVQDERPEIASVCKTLAEHVQKQGKSDAQAIPLVGSLAEQFARSGPRDQALIADRIGKALVAPRKKLDEKKGFDDALARAAASALGGLGELGARELIAGTEQRELRKNAGLLEEVLAALGRTKSERAVEVLLEAYETRSLERMRGAARGLVHFDAAPAPVRKRIFEGVFKPLMALADDARRADAANVLLRETFEAARDASYAALAAVSGHQAPDVDAWQRWWNDNKTRSWTKPGS